MILEKVRTLKSRLLVLLLAVSVLFPGAVLGQPGDLQQYGRFEYGLGGNGIIVTAPHGLTDLHSEKIAKIISENIPGSGYVLALGFRREPYLINVSYPTESGALVNCDRQKPTERAQRVYEEFVRLISRAANGNPVKLYVEIHGQSEQGLEFTMEVASKGISATEAAQLKEVFQAALSEAVKEVPSVPTIKLALEPLDNILLKASCSKTYGTLGLPFLAKALHFEPPMRARQTDELRRQLAKILTKVILAAGK